MVNDTMFADRRTRPDLRGGLEGGMQVTAAGVLDEMIVELKRLQSKTGPKHRRCRVIICELAATSDRYRNTPGECANCQKPVFESQFTLDDCYNVWAGKCPHCQAINLLSMSHGLRGYSSGQMWLVLPTNEEVDSNPELPRDCVTQGSKGPATLHGSNSGEFCYQLFGGVE